MTKLQPLNGFVLIKLEETEEAVTAGGIIVPDTAKEKSSEGVIEAIAVDAEEQVAIGDKVIYKQYAGTAVEFEGQEYIFVPVGEILAKLVEVDAI